MKWYKNVSPWKINQVLLRQPFYYIAVRWLRGKSVNNLCLCIWSKGNKSTPPRRILLLLLTHTYISQVATRRRRCCYLNVVETNGRHKKCNAEQQKISCQIHISYGLWLMLKWWHLPLITNSSFGAAPTLYAEHVYNFISIKVEKRRKKRLKIAQLQGTHTRA